MNIKYFDFKSLKTINATPEYYDRLRFLLRIKKILGKNLIRLGKPNDGGYVMVDNFNVSGGGGYCIFLRH